MAFTIFLQIDTITGSSTVKGHEGEIAVDSFSWDFSRAADATAITAGELHVVAPTGRHTPQLLQALADGTTFAHAHLSQLSPGTTGASIETLHLALDGLAITDLQLQTTAADGSLDRISLTVAAVTEDAKAQTAIGAGGPTATSGLVTLVT